MNIGKFKTHLKTIKYLVVAFTVLFGGLWAIDWISHYPKIVVSILIVGLLVMLYISVYKLIELNEE